MYWKIIPKEEQKFLNRCFTSYNIIYFNDYWNIFLLACLKSFQLKGIIYSTISWIY